MVSVQHKQAVTVPMWLLVLVTLSGTMAMHIFVPALPVAGQALGASPAGMQQTISLYVIGLALGQLMYGPISDTWGRRPALLVGLVLYFSASILALCAPNLQWLLVARVVQALGGAAGITLGRAIVRDTSPPQRVTKDLALLSLLTLVGPGLSPVLGAYLADFLGWRAIYVFLVLMGCAMLVCAWRLLPETNGYLRPFAGARIARDYVTLLRNPKYVAFSLAGACCTTALYPYLATAPYIVHEQLGLPIRYVGWFAASTIAGSAIGTLLTRCWAQQLSNERFMYVGAGLGVVLSLLFLLVQWMGALSAGWLLGITVCMTFGAGVASPAAMALVLSTSPQLVGTAAGLYGFAQMAMGALGTMVVGYGQVPALSCALAQLAFTGVALLSVRWAVRRT